MGLTTREFRRGVLEGREKVVTIVAVIVVAVLLVVAVRACSSSDTAPDPATAAGRGGGQASSSATATTAKGSLVPVQPGLTRHMGDPDWLTAAPQHISWQRVDGVPLPFSASDGPTRISGAVTGGYSNTPQGAVLAAAQIAFRLAFSPDYRSVVDAQTDVSDATRAQLIAAREAGPQPDPAVIAKFASAPVAFKVAAFADNHATIYLAFPRTGAATPMFRFARTAVIWEGGDWRYSDTPDPHAPPLPDAAGLDGFTRF